MRNLILYSTLGCHLCEQAKTLSEPILAGFGMGILEVDIADKDALMQHYGVRIPVLRDPYSNEELGWPFGAEELTDWVKQLISGETP